VAQKVEGSPSVRDRAADGGSRCRPGDRSFSSCFAIRKMQLLMQAKRW
jgi:hypothetical protein